MNARGWSWSPTLGGAFFYFSGSTALQARDLIRPNSGILSAELSLLLSQICKDSVSLTEIEYMRPFTNLLYVAFSDMHPMKELKLFEL